MNSPKTLAYFFIGYAAVVLFACVGAITTLQLPWYRTLTLPSFALPVWLTGVIWLVLFLCTALSFGLYFAKKERGHSFILTTELFSTASSLVLLWNYLFFGLHLFSIALVSAILLIFTLSVLGLRVRKVSKRAAALLIPFILWMLYAIYLTYQIGLLN